MPSKLRLSQASFEEKAEKAAKRSSTIKGKPILNPSSPHSKKRASLTGSSENLSVKEVGLAGSRQSSSGAL